MTLGGWVGLVVSIAVLALFTAYLALVVRARGFETDVDCACFGSMGPGRITTLTVWRNAWLVALAVARGRRRCKRRRAAEPGHRRHDAVAVARRSRSRRADGAARRGPTSPRAADAEALRDLAVEEGDYLRARTPAVLVTLGDGSTTHLRQLSAQRPQLLVYVSDGCFSCHDVIAAVPTWREQLPACRRARDRASIRRCHALTSREEPMSLHDTEGLVSESFGMRATPSAVLLGADGLLAGGPCRRDRCPGVRLGHPSGAGSSRTAALRYRCPPWPPLVPASHGRAGGQSSVCLGRPARRSAHSARVESQRRDELTADRMAVAEEKEKSALRRKCHSGRVERQTFEIGTTRRQW